MKLKVCNQLNNLIFVDGEFRSSPVIYQNIPSVSSFSPPMYMPQPRQFQSIAFPELQELSLDELTFLNQDTDRLDEFLDSLPLFKEQNKTMDDLVTNIEELAGKKHLCIVIFIIIYSLVFFVFDIIFSEIVIN